MSCNCQETTSSGATTVCTECPSGPTAYMSENGIAYKSLALIKTGFRKCEDTAVLNEDLKLIACALEYLCNKRKEKQDTLDFSASATFDFDADTADNKYMVLTADMTSMVLAATRPGWYTLTFEQGGTGNYTVVWPTNINGNPPQPSSLVEDKSVYYLYFDGTEFNA